jgi:hypothetical protein
MLAVIPGLLTGLFAWLLIFPSDKNLVLWVIQPGSGLFAVLTVIAAVATIAIAVVRIYWCACKIRKLFVFAVGVFLGAVAFLVVALHQGHHIDASDLRTLIWIGVASFSVVTWVAFAMSPGASRKEGTV